MDIVLGGESKEVLVILGDEHAVVAMGLGVHDGIRRSEHAARPIARGIETE